MIFDVQRKLTDLNKRVFDLENLLAGLAPTTTILELLSPPPFIPQRFAPSPHELGGPHHTFNEAIHVAYDTNTASHFGRAAIGWAYYNDVATFAHLDHNSQTGYALQQSHLGDTYLNAATARELYLTLGGSQRIRFASGQVIFNDTGLDIDHRWEASGEANALFIRGSDGKIGFWTTTLDARVNIGGTPGPAMINLPTNLSTIDAGLSTRDIANECIIMFGANVRSNYTGRTVQAEAGALVRIDTRDQDGGTTDRYTTFQVLTKAANATVGIYTVPFQIAAGAPDASLWITRTGKVNIQEDSATVRLSGTRQLTITIPDPEVGAYCQIYIGLAYVVTGFYGNTIGGTSCAVNVEERGTLGSSGTNILSSDMVADSNGESVTSSFNNSVLAAGNHLTVDVSAVTGTVSEVNITITVRLT